MFDTTPEHAYPELSKSCTTCPRLHHIPLYGQQALDTGLSHARRRRCIITLRCCWCWWRSSFEPRIKKTLALRSSACPSLRRVSTRASGSHVVRRWSGGGGGHAHATFQCDIEVLSPHSQVTTACRVQEHPQQSTSEVTSRMRC